MQSTFSTTGRLSNTTVANSPLARLTIGVTNAKGERAEMKFVRDDETTELVAQVPEIVSEAELPTEQELNEQYLAVNDWQRANISGMDAWEDAIGGGAYAFENALLIQHYRDMNADVERGGELCQDDAEYMERARAALRQTIVGDERIANRPDNPNWKGVAHWFNQAAGLE